MQTANAISPALIEGGIASMAITETDVHSAH